MADCIIAVSKDTKIDIENLFAVDANKVKVIHNGIDTQQFIQRSLLMAHWQNTE